MDAHSVSIPVSIAELFDKITILEIKLERIEDAAKRANVARELDALRPFEGEHISRAQTLRALVADLKAVNLEIWELEDQVRDCERKKDFGDSFVKVARAIYHTNDRRAAIKKQINLVLGSQLVEEKSYNHY